MAWRDSRTSRRRLAFSALSIVFGVAALVGIASLADNVHRGMDNQVKGLLGADMNVSSREPLPAAFDALAKERAYERSGEVQFSSMAVFPSKDGATRFVQVRAVDERYPIFGEFSSEPASAVREFQAEEGALIDEAIQLQFGLAVGDPVKLGKRTFKILGVLRKVPGETAALSVFAPRVFIASRFVPGTELLQRGSLVRYETHIKLPATAKPEEEKKMVLERFRDQGVGAETVEDRAKSLGQAIANVNAFLSLVGFVALILGAIGVASAVLVYIRQKLSTVAVLRCLGCSVRQAFLVYVFQGLALGLIGALLGSVLGVLIHYLVLRSAGDLLPVHTRWALSWPAVLKGLGAGVAVCLLFSLYPLMQVRRVSPLLALRSEFSPPQPKIDWWRVGLVALIGAAVLAFAVVQASNFLLGLAFTGALAVGLVVLAGTARLVTWAARRFCPANLPYAVRQGIANLHRPQNMTVLLLLALGLGTFMVVTIDLSRATQLKGLAVNLDRGRSNLLFFGVQDDQIEPLKECLTGAGAKEIQDVPVVTMRLASVGGKSVSEILKEKGAGRRRGMLTREFRSSYRAKLGPAERLVAGEWIGKVDPGTEPVPVSLEKGIAEGIGAKLGDILEFDVQGITMKTVVRSLREVEWRRLEANFFVLFPEGVLEGAPRFYMVGVHAGDAAESARLQRITIGRFPSVSAIDLGTVMNAVENIMTKVEMVVRVVALFTVATGLLVLAGAMLAGRFQRLRETVLLRTLGAQRAFLVRLQIVEYAILGLLSSLIGVGLAAIGNQLLATFLFKAPAAWPWTTLVGAVVAVTSLTVIIGWLSNRDLIREAPLVVLRREN